MGTKTTKGSGIRIVAGQHVSIGAAAELGGPPPKEVLLIPAPQWELEDGLTLIVDAAARRSVLAEFESHGVEGVIDYEHQTLYAADRNGRTAPAAGWVNGLREDERGIWATDIRWTEKAASLINAGEYRYISPIAFYDDATKRVKALALAGIFAMTNVPRTNNQYPLTARAAASLIEQFHCHGREREEGMKKWTQILASLLGRAATSKPADLLADAKALVGALEADGADAAGSDEKATVAASIGFATQPASPEVPEQILTLVGLEKGAPVAKVAARITALADPSDKVAKGEYDKVVARNTELQQKLDAAGKTGEVEQLVASNRNKLSPAREKTVREHAAKYGIAAAREMVAELPVLIAASGNQGGAPVAGQQPAGGDEENILVEVGDGELGRAEPNSATVAATCRAIMKEKGVSYAEANDIRKQREAAAAAEA